MYTILATAALLATTALADFQGIGSAVVINMCEYEVYLCNVPAADGGYSEVDKTLQPLGDSYSQNWTELGNGDGWSLKLSKDTSLASIMQYEYTFHNDGIIWFDMSDVNGNPWNGDWEFTADGNCVTKDQAYRYSTDDAYGMQACSSNATITVTLCSGESQDDSGAASATASAAGETISVAAATSAAPSTSAAATTAEASSSAIESSAAAYTSTSAYSSTPVESSTPVSSASATTFATSTTSSATFVTTAPNGYTVTEVATEVVTNIVTATQWWSHPRGRRDVHGHHARHIHA